MRAIVAEGNVVTRVTLRRLLERGEFEVEELRDELAAACLLHQPEAPDLALLALDTLLVDFAQVCAAMRAAKPEVYIVALVPEARRPDVPSVLEAGADDFMIKPVSIQEGEARLQVIQRHLRAFGGSARAAEAGDLALKAHADDRGPRELNHFLKDLDFPDVFRTVFSQLGLGPVLELDVESLRTPFFTVWAPMLLHQGDRAQWLNVRIDLDRPNAEALFEAVHPKARYSVDGLLHLLREIMSLAEDGIRTASTPYEDVQVYLPVLPAARRADEVPSPAALASAYARVRHIGLSLAGRVRLALSLTMEPVPAHEHPLSGLRPFDVLAAPIASEEYDTMLLRAGTMLNESYIDRIRSMAHARSSSRRVKVFPPPTGTLDFLAETRAAPV